MNSYIEAAISAINDLAESVRAATVEERPMSEFIGWVAPPLSRHDLATMAAGLSIRLSKVTADTLPSGLEVSLASIPVKVASFKGNPLQHLYHNQHYIKSLPIYLSLIDFVDGLVCQIEAGELPIDWERVAESGLMPSKLIRRLRSVEARIALLEPNLVGLEEKIDQIKQAHDLSERLPSDLQELNDARRVLDSTNKSIEESLVEMNARKTEAYSAAEAMEGYSNQAQRIIERCEDAYRAATTKGLASAFDARAKELKTSMQVWVGGLLVALIVGSTVGGARVREVSELLAADPNNIGPIIMNAVLALLSVGAPVWFAWLATKQIGQRFRLAEDYAFKASFAMAYEGYRNEASKLDESLGARLFGAAINRLDEAPLRLLDSSLHGSPMHELVESETFKRLLELGPETRDKLIGAIVASLSGNKK